MSMSVARLRAITPPRIRRAVKRRLPFAVRAYFATRGHSHWARAVIWPDTRRSFDELDPNSLNAVEVSGCDWCFLPWASYSKHSFPAFDLCSPPDPLPGPFDVVICEQVLEHVVDPLTAVRTLRQLCRPDGYVFVSTPFLIPLHSYPADYWRFTPAGLERLLRSQGLDPVWVKSWGNRRVIVANFDTWARRWPWQPLRNEPHLPVVVWALARPSGA
jgi:SAM-dependent methyltransferase